MIKQDDAGRCHYSPPRLTIFRRFLHGKFAYSLCTSTFQHVEWPATLLHQKFGWPLCMGVAVKEKIKERPMWRKRSDD